MKLYKYIFIFLASILITACAAPEESPKHYYSDESVHELIYAIEKGDKNTIQALIDAGVNVNTVGKNGVTPLFWAYLKTPESSQKKENFKLLLKNNADPLIFHEPTGKSVLTYAAINKKDSDYLRIILEEVPGIDVDQYLEATPHYPTALYHAILNKNNENVILLIKNGADVNFRDKFGDVALKIAAYMNWEAAYILLQNSADYADGEGNVTDGNPHGLSHIVWALENTRYVPALDGAYDWRTQIIDFLNSKKIKIYPLYEKDDPRFNPRPEITQYSVNNTETENAEEYNFIYQGADLIELTIKDSIILFDEVYTAALTYEVNEAKNFTLKDAQIFSDQPLLNLNTKTALNKKNLASLTADEIGIMVDEIQLSLDFIFRNLSLKEIINQYGTLDKVKAYEITDM